VATAAAPAAAEDFFATNAVTFGGLGLSTEVCGALQHAGYPRPAHSQVGRQRERQWAGGASPGSKPTTAFGSYSSLEWCMPLGHGSTQTEPSTHLLARLCQQELAVPLLLRGQDVVLAAETGSGKTLAYLAPLVDLALRSRQAEAAAAEAAAAAAAADGGSDAAPAAAVAEGEAARQRRRRGATSALVLCPNAALCEQVLAAAQALRDPASGAPLAAAAFVSSQCPPPFSLPDIVISTPGALVSLLDNSGPTYGYEWTREGGSLILGWPRGVAQILGCCGLLFAFALCVGD
jgi:hypothetical protein